MDDDDHNFDGSVAMVQIHCSPGDLQFDITKVHLSLERIQMDGDETMGKIETDVSNIKHSLQQTAQNTDSTSSQLQDLEDVVVKNQASLEKMLNDVRHQLSSVQQDIAASNAKLQHLECIGTIESSVLAFHNFMEKSLDHQKAILQCGSILYQKLSQEVAKTRGEIGDMVVGICQHISVFQESTINELTALQDSISQWPNSKHCPGQPMHPENATLLSELEMHMDLGWGPINHANHTHTDDFTEFELNSDKGSHGDCPPTSTSIVDDLSTTHCPVKSTSFTIAWCPSWWSRGASLKMVHAVGEVLVVVMVIWVVVNFWLMEGPTQIEELRTGERLLWQFCRDTWGTS
ncbi:hypothetical protein F4604DRAFT_1678547 [Suillus subluteus]|nr:hypothetical protein F4604DRAFT_1678547 [Suillus subluteus]